METNLWAQLEGVSRLVGRHVINMGYRVPLAAIPDQINWREQA